MMICTETSSVMLVLTTIVCDSGYVNTDMTKQRGSLTPDQGAQTPVALALRDLNGQSGLFWEHEKPSSW